MTLILILIIRNEEYINHNVNTSNEENYDIDDDNEGSKVENYNTKARKCYGNVDDNDR